MTPESFLLGVTNSLVVADPRAATLFSTRPKRNLYTFDSGMLYVLDLRNALTWQIQRQHRAHYSGTQSVPNVSVSDHVAMLHWLMAGYGEWSQTPESL